MKKIRFQLVYTLFIILITGCSSNLQYNSFVKVSKPIEQDCDVIVNVSSKNVSSRFKGEESLSSIRKAIKRDLETNVLLNVKSSKQKPIKVIVYVNKIKHYTYWLGHLLFPNPLLYYMGDIPLFSIYKCDIELQIEDTEGNLLAFYKVKKKDSASVFSYQKLHRSNSEFMSLLVKETMVEIKNQIQNDQISKHTNIDFLANKIRNRNQVNSNALAPVLNLFSDNITANNNLSITFKPLIEPIQIRIDRRNNCDVKSISIYSENKKKIIKTISRKIGDVFYWDGKKEQSENFINEGSYVFSLEGFCDGEIKEIENKIVEVKHIKPFDRLYIKPSDQIRKDEYRYTNKYRWMVGASIAGGGMLLNVMMMTRNLEEGDTTNMTGVMSAFLGTIAGIAIPVGLMKPAKVPDKENIEYNHKLDDRLAKTNQEIFKENFKIKLTVKSNVKGE